jgi:hypothetical protein
VAVNFAVTSLYYSLVSILSVVGISPKTQGNTSQWYRFTCYPLSNENAVSIPNQKDMRKKEREKNVRAIGTY